MAPGYRPSGRDRNRNRTYVDHDVFEGLPVRNWRRDAVIVAPPPVHETSSKPTDIWDTELPYGMPKDSHLLPQHSQDLLRAARSGKLYLKRFAVEEEEADAEVIVAEKPEKKEDENKDRGFPVKTWKLVPKHQEGPETEYLAKRRKGLVGNAIKAVAPPPVMTQTKVKRFDAAGNPYVEDVVVAQGEAIDGEVISQFIIPDVASANTIVTPQRRRDRPKSKKKAKIGRGRKKKPVAAAVSVPGEAGVVKAEGQEAAAGTDQSAVGEDGGKLENALPATTEDAEMGDDSIVRSGDEGEDDDEGEGSSDEDDDADGKGDGAGSGNQDDDDMDQQSPEAHDQKPTPPSTLPPHLNSDLPRPTLTHEYSGSPLKKVMTSASYDDDASPNADGEEEAEGDLDEPEEEEHHKLTHDHGFQEMHHNPYQEMGGQMGSPDHELPHDEDDMDLEMHPHHGSFHDDGEVDEVDMLLDDDDMDGVDFSAMEDINHPDDSQSHSHTHQHIDLSSQEPSHTLSSAEEPPPPVMLETALAEMQADLQVPSLPIIQDPTTLHPEEEEDLEIPEDPSAGFEDLLGGLIGHLDAQVASSSSTDAAAAPSATAAAAAAEATVQALEDVAVADDPDEALVRAAEVARAGVVAEAVEEGGHLGEEELVAEPVVGEGVVREVEGIERERADEVAEKMEIPVGAGESGAVDAVNVDGVDNVAEAEQIKHNTDTKEGEAEGEEAAPSEAAVHEAVDVEAAD